MIILLLISLLLLNIDAFQILQYRPLTVGSLRTRFHPSSSITCNISTTRCIRTSGVIFSSASADNNKKEDNTQQQQALKVEVLNESLTKSQIKSINKNKPLLTKVKSVFTNNKKFNMETLRKLGTAALLSYGFVSNVSGVIAVSSAWFIFSKKVREYYVSVVNQYCWIPFLISYRLFMTHMLDGSISYNAWTKASLPSIICRIYSYAQCHPSSKICISNGNITNL